MSTEPVTSTIAPADAAATSERGLLIAMLVLVLFGVGAMLMIS